MFLNKTIKTLICVLFINNSYGIPNVKPRLFKIVEKGKKIFLQNDEPSGYNPKELLKFVQNYGDIEYNVKNILNMNKSKYPDGKHPLGTGRILAKRIVPSAQITPDFEYDKKSETYFKPLVKIHKVKKMAKRETNPSVSSDSFDLSSSENDESKQDIKIYDINGLVPNSNRDLHYLKPKEKNENDESKQDITIYDINGPVHNSNRDLHYLEPKEKRENDESEQDIIIYDINGPIHKNNRKKNPKEKKESQNINKKQENIRMSIEEQGARFLKDIQQMTHLLQDKRQKNIIKDKVSVIVQELENLHGNLFDLVDKTVHLRVRNYDNNNIISLPISNLGLLKRDTTVQEKKLKNTNPFLPHNPIWNFWTVR